jgi:hypothetical protein
VHAFHAQTLRAKLAGNVTMGRTTAQHHSWLSPVGQSFAAWSAADAAWSAAVFCCGMLLQGGATHFDHLGISVQPKQGMALLFFPSYANGTADPRYAGVYSCCLRCFCCG